MLIGNKSRVSTLEKLRDEPDYGGIVEEHGEFLGRQSKSFAAPSSRVEGPGNALHC